MRQSDFYKSLGLGDIVTSKRKMNKVLRLASFEPDFSYERKQDKKGRIYFDRYKYLGGGFGISVQGFRHMRLNKEGQKVEKHVVLDWGVFAQGHEDNGVTNAFVDTDADQVVYCFAEDTASGNAFEFRVNNVLEAMDIFKTADDYNAVLDFEAGISKVNVAMLMIFGTVLLPVAKNEQALNFRAMEDAMQKELLARARSGDAAAEQNLIDMAKKQETDLRKRLAREDLLSVFEGYFLNLIEQSGIFSILADILEVEEITNEASREKLYRLTVSVTGIKMTLYISKADTVGMPLAGMRVMGMGLLQGQLIMNSE